MRRFNFHLSVLVLFLAFLTVSFTTTQAQDSVSFDSTTVYMEKLSSAATVFAVAESALVCPEMLGVAQALLHLSPDSAGASSRTRRNERESLLAYWMAAGNLYAAQAAYLAYTGDQVGAYFARRSRDEAYAKSYTYIPSQSFQPVIGGRLKIDG